MSCLACSATLLELFVRRATGLDVKLAAQSTRTLRAQTGRKRAFSTRFPSVLLYSAASRASDFAHSVPVPIHDELLQPHEAQSTSRSKRPSLENSTRYPRGTGIEQHPRVFKERLRDISSNFEHDGRSVLELNDDNIRALLEVATTNRTEPFDRHRRNDNKPGDARGSYQSSRARRESQVESRPTRDKREGMQWSHKQAIEDKPSPLDAVKSMGKEGVATKTPFGVTREPWQVQKDVLSKKFGEAGWNPRKRLSPDALEGIRALHAQDPNKFTTPFLADQFQITPEAIRRILKSKWRPTEEEQEDRRTRWDKRGEKIWTKMVELGAKPPKKWREMGVGMPQWKLDKDAKRRKARRNKEKTILYTDEKEPESGWEGAVSQRIL